MQKIEPLFYGNYYHIYNKGINGANLFYSKRNYEYFLHLYKKYIFPVADTYAWCLMPNHFHLLVRIKEEGEELNLKEVDILTPVRVLNPDRGSDKRPIHLNFSDLFNSYSQAINKQEIRTGSLFQRPFKRINIDTENYLRKLVVYINNNPVKHGFVNLPEQWAFSSYNSIIAHKTILLGKKKVISWFDDLDNFKAVHKHSVQINTELQLEE